MKDDWKNRILLFNYSIKLDQALWLRYLPHMMEDSKRKSNSWNIGMMNPTITSYLYSSYLCCDFFYYLILL